MLTKRTPCVGICSTTYGDLVCRGCKRFAHEIVQWNGYNHDQQASVWQRLHRLRDEVVLQYLHVENRQKFALACERAQTSGAGVAARAYAVTRLLVEQSEPLHSAGLVAINSQADALQVLQTIDAEIYKRSLAHYERNFKIPL